jgi:hypothetical protein
MKYNKPSLFHAEPWELSAGALEHGGAGKGQVALFLYCLLLISCSLQKEPAVLYNMSSA